jgi:hypothetical protein
MSDSRTPLAVRCPFCDAASAQLLSLFGSQLLLSQYRCHACGSYFEGIRPDRWQSEPVGDDEGGSDCAQQDARERAELASPSPGSPPRGGRAQDPQFARICDHPHESAVPATGENEDGR